jgi:hypothetical protein
MVYNYCNVSVVGHRHNHDKHAYNFNTKMNSFSLVLHSYFFLAMTIMIVLFFVVFWSWLAEEPSFYTNYSANHLQSIPSLFLG